MQLTLLIWCVIYQVTCGRCSTAEAMLLQFDAAAKDSRVQVQGTCKGCHAELALEGEPRLMHERSNVLALLRPTACQPADMLPSLLSAQCATCSATLALRCVPFCFKSSPTGSLHWSVDVTA